MAISKQRKEEVVAQYKDWLGRSQAIILVEYTGVTMKDIDAVRAKVREVGGEFHVVKNTLVKLAFEQSGLALEKGLLENSTAIGFAFNDVAATAKALADISKSVQVIKVKGGYLGSEMLSASRVKALADLPSLPIVRSQLLGVLQAPASKLVRTIAEPARSLAAVLQAYTDKAQAPA